MGLSIYDTISSTDAASDGGTYTNPVRLTVDGKEGSNLQLRKYLGTDLPDTSYSSITLQAQSSGGGQDLVSGTNGFSIKLYQSDDPPSEYEWENLLGGNTLEVVGAVTDSQRIAFWIRLDYPTYTAVNLRNVSLRLNSTKTSI